MVKIIVLLAVIAAGYWYYQGPYQESRLVTPEQRAADNLREMERCMRQERSISAGGAMAGAMTIGEDVESRCAEKLGLEQRNGQWMSR